MAGLKLMDVHPVLRCRIELLLATVRIVCCMLYMSYGVVRVCISLAGQPISARGVGCPTKLGLCKIACCP